MGQQAKSSFSWAALAVCMAATFALAGCGGDGGSDSSASGGSAGNGSGGSSGSNGGDNNNTTPPAATRNAAEGRWEWEFTGGSGFDRLFIFEDGTVWHAYGDTNWNYTPQLRTDPNLEYIINGVEYGSASFSTNGVTGSLSDIDWDSPGVVSHYNFSGTVSAQNQLTVVNTTTGSSGEPMTYDPSYDQPIALTTLAGNYVSTHLGPGYPHDSIGYAYAAGTVTITSGGVLTMTDAAGCAASGTIAQHQTSRGPVGVFDIRVTFSGATCPLGNGTVGTGIAYQSQGQGGTFLEAIGVTGNNAAAFAFRAHRAP
jgi:hypothetical protein